MGGADEDTRIGAEIGHGKGDFGVGASFIKEINGDAIAEEEFGNQGGEVLPAHAAVVSEDDALQPFFFHVAGDADGFEKYDFVIEGVWSFEDAGADAFLLHTKDGLFVESHFSADASGAEFDFGNVSIRDVRPLFCMDGVADAIFELRRILINIRIAKPINQIGYDVLNGELIIALLNLSSFQFSVKIRLDGDLRLLHEAFVLIGKIV